jgi:hypothetical protein
VRRKREQTSGGRKARGSLVQLAQHVVRLQLDGEGEGADVAAIEGVNSRDAIQRRAVGGALALVDEIAIVAKFEHVARVAAVLLGADDLNCLALAHDRAEQRPDHELRADSKPDLLLHAAPG